MVNGAPTFKQTVARKKLVLGLQHYTRQVLEAMRRGQLVQINVLGAFRASDAVKRALAGRIK